MVLEEADGLPDDLCIHLIPQIGDPGNSRVLHQHVTKKFRDAFADEYNQNGNRKQCPHAVNLRRKKGIQVDVLVYEGILDKKSLVIGSSRIQYAVKNGRDHERDQTLRQPNERETHNFRPQAAPYTA